jgi:hypothetical protein
MAKPNVGKKNQLIQKIPIKLRREEGLLFFTEKDLEKITRFIHTTTTFHFGTSIPKTKAVIIGRYEDQIVVYLDEILILISKEGRTLHVYKWDQTYSY